MIIFIWGGFPKVGARFLAVPIRMIIVFGDLYLGLPVSRDYLLREGEEGSSWLANARKVAASPRLTTSLLARYD